MAESRGNAYYRGGADICMNDENIVLPNFLIVGAPRCGTTSTYHYLMQHPDVYLTAVKEPGYLYLQSQDALPRGSALAPTTKVRIWDEYVRLFRKGRGKRAIGEASTETLCFHEQTIPEIRKRLGNPKILIMVRNPVDRAFSSYQFLLRDGLESLSFEESLSRERERIEENWNHMWRYRSVSCYTPAVEAFMNTFDDVFVGLFDDLRKDPLGFTQSVYRFLDVDPEFTPNVKLAFNRSGRPASHRIQRLIVRRAKWKPYVRAVGCSVIGEHRWARFRDAMKSRFVSPRPELNPDIWRSMIGDFEDDIWSLQKLLGRDLSHWLRVPAD